MKKLLGLLIGTILFLTSFNLQAQCTCVPDSILTNIVDELIVKDGLVYVLQRKDSAIVVYKQREHNLNEKIAQLELNAEEYQEMLDNKDRIMAYATAESKDLKKEIRKLKISNTLLKLVVVAETILIGLTLI